MKTMLRLLMALLASVSASAQTQYFYQNSSVSFNTIPFNHATNNCRQWLYLSSELNMPSGYINRIVIQSYLPATPDFAYLSIKLGTTSATSFASGTYATGLSTAYFGAYSGSTTAPGNYVSIILQTPFYYDNTQNLIVECAQSGMTSGFSVMQANVTARSIYGNATASSGILQGKLAVMGFEVGSTPTPLPVNITSFDASHGDNANRIHWATVNEANIDHYQVQRSADGISFAEVGTVAAKADGQHSHSYEFADNTPVIQASERLYYRLQVAEKNNNSFFSSIISIRNMLSRDALSVSAGPNPFTDHVRVSFNLTAPDLVQLALKDPTGKVLLQKSLPVPAGASEITLDEARQLPPGIYFLTAAIQGHSTRQRIVKN